MLAPLLSVHHQFACILDRLEGLASGDVVMSRLKVKWDVDEKPETIHFAVLGDTVRIIHDGKVTDWIDDDIERAASGDAKDYAGRKAAREQDVADAKARMEEIEKRKSGTKE